MVELWGEQGEGVREVVTEVRPKLPAGGTHVDLRDEHFRQKG